MDEWIKKLWYIYKSILLSHKKIEILPFGTTWIDLVVLMLNQVSQTERKTTNDLSHMWNLGKKKVKKNTKLTTLQLYSQ